MAFDVDNVYSWARVRAGIDTTDALAADNQLLVLVNAAYRTICNERDWDWLTSDETINVTSDDDEYAVAADWRTTLYVGRQVDTAYPDGYVALSRANRRQLREHSTYAGPPEMWMIEGGTLRIAPVPSETWTLLHVYVQKVSDLTAGSDTFLIPDDLIDLLVVRVARLLATRMGDTELAAGLRGEERDIMSAVDDEISRARGTLIPRYRQDTHWGG